MVSRSMMTIRKLRRFATAPYRALCHARDLYVKSLGGCAGKAQRPPFAAAMPRSRSHAAFLIIHQTGEADVGELIRAASTRTSAKARAGDGGAAAVPRRSQSVAGAMMRIDEGSQCSFDEGDVKVGLGGLRQYPRSRSCAAVPRRRPSVVTA